ncbi:NAD(P)/FAD-dependent oxidoreductase [Pararhizobium haloflavum]|uniref:NAD(P)/FAD-dependent oxidoreductase n=1 Tax=Pararhizobium haloflavum TaxID=2037914 RepID=UPI000C1A745F|nr:FAD-dependent oxidoreductase [Pararhizobium haloflavum]
MTDQGEPDQDDLRGGQLLWEAADFDPQPLGRDDRTNVLVVGAGITGSLIAQHIAARGINVTVVDREKPGRGSTLASTAMLQWEIDSPLLELAERYGFDHATRIYQHSVEAVRGLSALVRDQAIDCSFADRPSLYIAAGEAGPRELLHEHQARQRAGLPGTYLEHADLLSRFGIDRAAAIASPGSAEANPALLAQHLLRDACRNGARLIKDEALSYDNAGRSVGVAFASGHLVEAEHVLLATGYVMPDFVPSTLHSISSSFALATPPQSAAALWPARALIWEASESYAYLRTTQDDRIIVGGEDEPDVSDPEARNRMMSGKREALLAILQALWPHGRIEADRMWSGAFGETTDGLPLIGPVPSHGRILAAYGYGGNGITFSFMASRILADMVAGKRAAWHDDFALDRD